MNIYITAPAADIKWPEWLMSSGPDAPSSLDAISGSYARIKLTILKDHVYEHVMQKELNAVTDEMIEKGVVTVTGEILNHNVILPREFQAALLHENGAACRMLNMLCSAKKMAIVHLIEATHQSFTVGNLLVALICLRSFIEHVAHFNEAIEKTKPYNVPSNHDEANKLLWEIKEKLVGFAYATRVDWERILFEDTDEMIRKSKVKYKPVENRQDRTAESILDFIDRLSKKVKGIRAVYEVLCEFAHPNVGLLVALTRSVNPYLDKHGFTWIKKELSLKAQLAAVESTGPVLNQIFCKTAQCMKQFEELLVEGDAQCEKIRKISQVSIRHVLTRNKSILDPYSLCPCGSTRKIKFCCGAANI